MPKQCDCHFTDVFTLISLYKAFVFSFTIQFETWRLFCLRYNHWAQVIYCGPNIMTAILQTNFKCIFLHGNCCTFLEISFKFENTLANFVNDVFKYFSWMETFAVFIQIRFFFKWLTKNKLTLMQMTWGRVGGKPLYAEYQINIGNTNNRVQWITYWSPVTVTKCPYIPHNNGYRMTEHH